MCASAVQRAMSIDADRRSAILGAKLRALVDGRRGGEGAVAGSFPGGATLQAGSTVWVLVDTEPARRLGSVLAWAAKARAREVHVLVDDPLAAGVLARRAGQFRRPPAVWLVEGRSMSVAAPAAPAVPAAPSPEGELYRPVLAAAGLDVVVEEGQLIGEVLGLEVARVVVGDGPARVEAGVGKFDREASSLMFAELGESDAVMRAADIVRGYRHARAERHPLNQLVPERWLRAVLVDDPALVGAAELSAVESAVPRRNLKERSVATAVGCGFDGRPIVVTCSTGVDLELVPAAADDRLTYRPDARLVLAVPSRDALPITTALAGALIDAAEVTTVDDDWRSAVVAGGAVR